MSLVWSLVTRGAALGSSMENTTSLYGLSKESSEWSLKGLHEVSLISLSTNIYQATNTFPLTMRSENWP